LWLFRATEKGSLLLSRAVRGQGNPDTVKPRTARLLQSTLGRATQTQERLHKRAAHAKAGFLVLAQP